MPSPTEVRSQRINELIEESKTWDPGWQDIYDRFYRLCIRKWPLVRRITLQDYSKAAYQIFIRGGDKPLNQ
jgi:hypothetical protein